MDTTLDEANAAFWDELCGTQLAKAVGITDTSPASLEAYDAAYMKFYPYLARYLDWVGMGRVLEVGIGYGTVARELKRRGADHTGLDIARAPAELVGGVQGSILDAPFTDETFDAVVAIGSLHHTGNLERAVSEVHRVLRPGGRALVMVYNARSVRQSVTVPVARALARVAPARREALMARTLRDSNADGNAAPHTDFVTRAEARRLFAAFRDVNVSSENANASRLIGRGRLMRVAGRVAGLDLYIRAYR